MLPDSHIFKQLFEYDKPANGSREIFRNYFQERFNRIQPSLGVPISYTNLRIT